MHVKSMDAHLHTFSSLESLILYVSLSFPVLTIQANLLLPKSVRGSLLFSYMV